ncbi:DUF429 domain-containing protein [Acidimicrobium ferrooxidans]|nr:DUF429 domain-containing protein [Acidimicrobium ferrooxidans]
MQLPRLVSLLKHGRWAIGQTLDADKVLVGVDVPFGWPNTFSSWVSAHTPLDPLELSGDEFRYRATELYLRQHTEKKVLPWSVVTRLQIPAKRFAEALWKSKAGVRRVIVQPNELPITDDGLAVMEVYPGATLKVAWPDHPPYKFADDVGIEDLVTGLRGDFPGFGEALDWASDDDDLDAVISALTVAMCDGKVTGYRNHDPGDADSPSEDQLKTEGWIFFPEAVEPATAIADQNEGGA